MNILNNFFSKIYCINLKEREDRWNECERIFSKYNLEVERFFALEPNVSAACCINDNKFSLIRTHKKIIETARQDKLNNVLIFEDDIEFCDDMPGYSKNSFELRFKESIGYLPEQWDVLYLGCGNYTNNWHHVGNELYKVGWAFTTHAIAINHTFFDTIIKNLENPIQELDVIYCQLLHKHNCYSFNPNLVSQRESFSDIEGKPVNYSNLRNYF
jgi:hypothetical protein